MAQQIEFRGYALPIGFSIKSDEIRDRSGCRWELAMGWEGNIVLHSSQGEIRSVRLAAEAETLYNPLGTATTFIPAST